MNLEKRIETYKEKILEAERYIWKNPEPGYKEFKTNEYMLGIFRELGYEVTRADGITGFFATLDTGREGPTVLILAELDSLINRSHPECDKETGAVHSCGHHAQCAAMVGIAAALKEEGALDGLSGKIKLCLVPAEEGIEINYRRDLINKGIISFASGKTEFISRGYFNDVDLAFMVHSRVAKYPGERFALTIGHNGVVRKYTVFKGKAAHAGGKPHEGINALNAATTALNTVNSLRETFREKDYVRFHSIITKGGDAVNAVPDEVCIESYVRAANSDALVKVNKKINRALAATAAAFGANVEINDMPGSEPLHEDLNLRECAREVLVDMFDEESIGVYNDWSPASTDMGDVSAIVPSIHAYACGGAGTAHGKDFVIADPINACVDSARFQLALLEKLLSNGAEKAKEIIATYTPVFSSIEEYVAHKKRLNNSGEAVVYNEDGTATLKF